MAVRYPCVLVLPMLLACLGSGAGAADTPDPDQVRSQIDVLIAKRLNHNLPANLGLLHETCTLSISYGAPAYNNGDHVACMAFYHATIASLLKAFSGVQGTSPLAAPDLKELGAAAGRSRIEVDVERQAWSLRFGFDQVDLSYRLAEATAQAQVQCGAQYFSRGDYAEAEVAFGRGAEYSNEIEGESTADSPLNARIAPLLHAQTLLMIGRAADAAQEMSKAILLVPELLSASFDLHSLSIDQAIIDTAVATAQAAATAHPADADALFLLAVEQRFTGHADQAATTLAGVLTLAPHHPGACLMNAPSSKDAGFKSKSDNGVVP